ncbi:hypothetical protein [Legionella quateirensis]|uniref:Uncharacterized protein n=1 Tax=Legionella quateirensis TaxID=45072 RepID=A0A378KSW7_9GAMM|nr:hypothetical protein [Legionella quateirensis]KTD51336.1 hypothetical protein Lqua_1563 [Legionella quateirensis]STY17416.1 Uncharacterised protein [Legionella quateirensis]
MYLKLNETYFRRNRSREKEFGDIFNKTSRGLNSLMPMIITMFFTPALITTTLFSKEIILILANLSLSLGYLTNFAYRIYKNQVSKSELFVSLISLTAFLTLAYFLCPPVATISFISALTSINLMAVAVNLFFLIKHVIVPPCKKFIENVAQLLGFDIAGRYYSKPPLTLENDRYIIDHLLKTTYKHDSYSPEFNPIEIDSFNNMLTKLSQYIDKYDESLLGYINNQNVIADLEDQIAKLTTQGNPDPGYTFIRKKIGFKTTKIHLLEEARDKILAEIKSPKDNKIMYRFFKGIVSSEFVENPQPYLNEGVECLQNEINRQQEKINSLNTCLPNTGF